VASAYVVVTFAAVSAVAKQSRRREGGAGTKQAVPEQIPHLTMIANSKMCSFDFLKISTRRSCLTNFPIEAEVRERRRRGAGHWQMEVDDGGSVLNQ
jgi:hypothetical protein